MVSLLFFIAFKLERRRRRKKKNPNKQKTKNNILKLCFLYIFFFTCVSHRRLMTILPIQDLVKLETWPQLQTVVITSLPQSRVACQVKQNRPTFACRGIVWQFAHFCTFPQTPLTTTLGLDLELQTEGLLTPRTALTSTTTHSTPSLRTTTLTGISTYQTSQPSKQQYFITAQNRDSSIDSSTANSGGAVRPLLQLQGEEEFYQDRALMSLLNFSMNGLISILSLLSLILIAVSFQKIRKFFLAMENLQAWNARNVELTRL